MFRKGLNWGLLLVILLSLIMAGCQAQTNTTATKAPLKVGALSMMTVLPLYVAQQERLFQAQGVNIEIVPFKSQVERDTALNAGQIDAVIEDIYSAPMYNKDSNLIKVVAVSPVKGYMFAIIASKQSTVKSVSDLKNVEIASSL